MKGHPIGGMWQLALKPCESWHTRVLWAKKAGEIAQLLKSFY